MTLNQHSVPTIKPVDRMKSGPGSPWRLLASMALDAADMVDNHPDFQNQLLCDYMAQAYRTGWRDAEEHKECSGCPDCTAVLAPTNLVGEP